MKKTEILFLESAILDLIDNNNKVDISDILDYLDYINKVRYKEEDIKPILKKLVKEKRIMIINDFYLKGGKVL